MQSHDEDYPPADIAPERSFDPDRDNPPARAGKSGNPTPRLPDYGEEEDYEEPDRDTDLVSFYAGEELEDEAFEEDDFEPEDFEPEDFEPDSDYEDDDANPGEAAGKGASIWDFEEFDEEDDRDTGADETAAGYDDADPIEPEPASLRQGTTGATAAAYDWRDEADPDDDGGEPQKWPLGMVIVGAIALLLLAAGGYGVIQQRSAMEEEIRQLQASLAVAVSPEEVAGSRAAIEQAQQRNAELQAALDALALDNQRLTDTVAGLETQLQAQQEALARREAAAKQAESAPPPAKPVKAAATANAAPAPTAAATGGDWFVNFGSYTVRDTARRWADKLHPSAGRVVISTGTREGATFYRVRVVELTSRDQAEALARELETEYQLSKLWVGRQ